MSIDSKTLDTLQYHARRMRFALSEGDEKEAAAIQDRIDAILDSRPGVHAVAHDGEVVFDNASPWIKGQVEVRNETGKPEPVLTPEQWEKMFGPDDGTASGGVGLLDRP